MAYFWLFMLRCDASIGLLYWLNKRQDPVGSGFQCSVGPWMSIWPDKISKLAWWDAQSLTSRQQSNQHPSCAGKFYHVRAYSMLQTVPCSMTQHGDRVVHGCVCNIKLYRPWYSSSCMISTELLATARSLQAHVRRMHHAKGMGQLHKLPLAGVI